MSETINKLEYSIQRVTSSVFPELPDGGFVASTPYRHVSWLGATEQEAIASMLYGLCDLVKRGYLDPENPHAPADSDAPPAVRS